MTKHIVLDSTPLSALCEPAKSGVVVPISVWATDCMAAGHKIYVPEIIDCELRRELIRAGKTASLARLDALKTSLRYLSISTPAMLLAAKLWAQARNRGTQTAHNLKLDVDVILAAQALTLDVPSSDIIVATVNLGHLAQFVPADMWANIQP